MYGPASLSFHALTLIDVHWTCPEAWRPADSTNWWRHQLSCTDRDGKRTTGWHHPLWNQTYQQSRESANGYVIIEIVLQSICDRYTVYTVNRRNTPKCFLIYSLQNLTDCGEIWYILSWVNLSYRNVNLFRRTWIVSLPNLVKLSIPVLQVNSS